VQGAGLQIADMTTLEADLEDVFLQLTRGAHEGEFGAAGAAAGERTR
jgi:ABC-2 type transport system ATP-binding protein